MVQHGYMYPLLAQHIYAYYICNVVGQNFQVGSKLVTGNKTSWEMSIIDCVNRFCCSIGIRAVLQSDSDFFSYYNIIHNTCNTWLKADTYAQGLKLEKSAIQRSFIFRSITCFSDFWRFHKHLNKMADLFSNRPFCSNDLIISSEHKEIR